ncbi:PorP/SprF family type IX secretion system membrane protein [Flammeovirgaceae bacterium SG7u.111]|nr:PorP/SprF family type IX secretion system membrane protein [Flammeovirgaceae bacterium SG7u.132]WPO36793.1 PorP/SprF family type IX secretion system membrane protein [Flammeovirgaceae bacterium SG7u.111]
MNKKSIKRLLPIIVGCLLLASSAQAQEPNFSLYHYTPFFTNPGEIGAVEDTRVMLNYRNQQLDLDENITSSSVSAYYPIYIGHNRLVTAINFLNDKNSEFLSSNGGMLGLSYSLKTTKSSELSFGLQAGFFQRKIGEGFTTDEQFVNGVFDPNAISTDAVLNQSVGYPIISGGLFYKVKDDLGLEKAFIGASIFNVNGPNISLMGDQKDNLPMSIKGTAGYRVFRGGNFSVLPTARWVYQAGNSFLNVGSRFAYELSQSGENAKKIELGIWYNTNDYGVFSLAYEQPSFTLALSYDKTIGTELGSAQKGVFELAISFRLQKKEKPTFVEAAVQEVIGPEEVAVEEIDDAAETMEEVEEPAAPEQKVVEEETTAPEEKPDVPEEVAVSKTTFTPAEKAILAKIVNFDLNTYDLDKESKAFLNGIADILREKEGFEIELVGHSCDLGSEKVNKFLSLNRAETVKDYLVGKGVDINSIKTVGMGEEVPLEGNDTPEGREHNRRVEFKVVY